MNQLLEPEQRITLARLLGDVPHVSPLWQKIRTLCDGSDDRVLEWLLKCAVERGASHYNREFPRDLPADCSALTNEELAVALCLGQDPYHSAFVRAAAQFLSSASTDAPYLCRLAVKERVERVLLHIAGLANRFDQGAHPWAYLLEHLPSRSLASPDALPHWSRFVSQTGVTPYGGGPDIKWLRRRERR